MSTHNKEAAEREAFEKWVKTRPGHPFAGQFLNLMWAAWLARSALTASEAPATEQAPPLPEPYGGMLRMSGGVEDVYTADQMQTYAEQYAVWKIAALRSKQAPAGDVPSIESILIEHFKKNGPALSVPTALSTPPAMPQEPHPLECMHINQGSADAAADAYEAEYLTSKGKKK